MGSSNDMDPLVPSDSTLVNEFRREYNDIMDNFPVTNIEEALFAKNAVVMQAFRLKGGRTGFSGNVICFPQRVSDISTILPRKAGDLKIIVARCKTGPEPTDFKDFRVRREHVRQWLFFLKKWSSAYSDVEISVENMEALPENDSVYMALRGAGLEPDSPMDSDSDSISSNIMDTNMDEMPGLAEEDEDYGFESGPVGSDDVDIVVTGIGEEECPQSTEVQHILDALVAEDQPQVDAENVILWPERGLNPIDERTGSHILACAFPTLFPCGTGDITYNINRRQEVTFNEAIKHYVKYYDSERKRYPFVENPRFMHYVQDKDERSRIQAQCSVYLQKNPEDAAMTIGDLRNDLHGYNNPTLYLITKKMQRFGANIMGSPAYMASKKKELLALMDQEGVAHIWYTLTMPSWMWQDLYNLWDAPPVKQIDEDDDAFEERSIKFAKEQHLKNPHIINEFFLKRVANFTKNFFGSDFLDTIWNWYRIEWQKRGAPHVHGMCRLKNAAEFTELSKKVIDGRRSHVVLDWIKNKSDQSSIYWDLLQDLPRPSDDDELEMKEIFHGLKDRVFERDDIQLILDNMKEGNECELKIVTFRDYVMTSGNSNIPVPSDASRPYRDDVVDRSNEVHPCRVAYSEYRDTGSFSLSSPKAQSTYNELVDWCQRHRHNQSYCLRNDKHGECRFKFPKPLNQTTKIAVSDILYLR